MKPQQIAAQAATLVVLLAQLSLSQVAAAAPDPSERWTSATGNFQVAYTSDLDPITINRIHHWTLHLETSKGEPVTNAEIRVQGGMPEHDHGFPTAPQISRAAGDGDYRLEGLRFHMPGAWEIQLEIRAGKERDTIIIPLHL